MQIDDALNGVSCLSSRFCVAVGGHTTDEVTGASLPMAERWNGHRWARAITSIQRGASISSLAGVSCPSARSCTAVGFTSRSKGCTVGPGPCILRSLVEHFDGRRWRIDPLGKALRGPHGGLTSVSCPSRTTCSAVGDQRGQPIDVRWDGRRWAAARFQAPKDATTFYLSAISCASAIACVAVGARESGAGCRPAGRGTCTSKPLMERWNGKRWALQRFVGPAGASSGRFSAVSCRPRGVCVATGVFAASDGQVPFAERGHGASWRLEYPVEPRDRAAGDLRSVSCTIASSCIAVGLGPSEHGLVARWNGMSWVDDGAPGPAGLSSVSCAAATECMAVGNGPVADLLTGGKWRSLSVPAVKLITSLAGVSCATPSMCVAVGSSGDGVYTQLWNGARWTAIPAPSPPGASGAILAGVSCATSTECIAVGHALFRSNPSSLPLVERWDGSKWAIEDTPTLVAGGALNGVSCASATACEAVGYSNDGSLAEGWDGSAWTIQTSSTVRPGTSLNGVSCVSTTACEAVGSSVPSTLTETWNGTSWSVQTGPSPAGAVLTGVSCTSLATCEAVGFVSTPSIGEAPIAQSFR